MTQRTLRTWTFFVSSLIFFIWTESTTDETLELKFQNRHFHASSSAMCAMLKRADLENNGYKKKIITNVVEEPGSNKTNSQACHVCMHDIKYLYLYLQYFQWWPNLEFSSLLMWCNFYYSPGYCHDQLLLMIIIVLKVIFFFSRPCTTTKSQWSAPTKP